MGNFVFPLFFCIFVLDFMKSIANILTDGRFENDGLYNVVKEPDELISGIPTLVIGWEKTKALFPEASIIEWKINEDTYWTWGNRERREVQERDLVRFRKLAISRFINSVKYVFLSVFTASQNTMNKFFNSLSDERRKFIYGYNDVIYIYYEGNNNIIGISLVDIEYCGMDKKDFFRPIYAGKNNVIIKDEIPFKIKNELKNQLYVIPYLYSE